MTPGHEKHGGADRIEQLLEHASPRPAPPADDAERIREAVHAEWRTITTRRRRRHWTYAAAAAAIALCAVFAPRFTATDHTQPVVVAQIDKQVGAVYFVQDDTGLVELGDTRTLFTGQVVQTARTAGLGFVLENGLSVRLDEDSRVEFVGRDLLYLQRGRVYVDAPESEAPRPLTIRTDGGLVTHVGTRYMVAIAGDELTVNVRDGEVHIDGRYYDADATTGEQVTMLGGKRPVLARLAAHDGPWRWTELLSPPLDIDGMRADEFLQWVGRETGYRIVYDDDAARVLAGDTVLKGVVDRDPRTELQLRLLTMDLGYDLDDARGQIHIRGTGDPR